VLVAGFSDTYCILGLVPSQSEIRSLDSFSTSGGVLSREASLELLQDGRAVAVSSLTVMAGTMGDSKTNAQRFVTVFFVVLLKKCPRLSTLNLLQAYN
jgi:hypothetical protein